MVRRRSGGKKGVWMSNKGGIDRCSEWPNTGGEEEDVKGK